MRKLLLLKSLLLLCALVVGSNVWADTATITFTNQSSGTSDSNTAYSTDDFVSSGIASSSTAFGTITCSATSKCYSGKTGHGLKAGASGKAGSFTIAFSALTNVTKITLNRASYSNSKTANITVKNGSTTLANAVSTPSSSAEFADMDISSLNITSLSGLTVETSQYCYIKSITITYSSSSAGTTAAPTISGNTPFFGSTTVTITNAASADDADRYYTLNGSDPTTTTSATCFAYSDAFSIDATTTVKAIAKKSTDTNASSVVSKTFTKVTPMSVASALTAIAALDNNGTIADQCVRGIVTKVTSLYNNTAINYTISDDVTGSNELTVYRGKNMHNTDFAALSDIKLGDDVVIYGTLKKYVKNTTTTPEFDEGNYLLYQVSKDAPTFTLDRSNATLSMGNTESVDVELTTNTDGAISCKSSNTDVATVALKSAGVYTITAVSAGSATITIESTLTDNYQPASATVAITVNDTREAAGLAFANASVSKTWGETFTGQELTNPNSLDVTWSSTNEAVATVNSSGVVSVLKAGTTTIKASFDGDATYKKQIVSYTLTINKASAGLSYAVTEFDIMLNDDSFVAPTLINPNGLTVTYASNNTDVAVVDENTGELDYDETAAGTAKITASFAGNDNYYPGSANYTINIVDPSVKGSKYNPYTVAELADLTENLANVYVTGYIIGCVNNNKCYKTTTASLVNTNILLADTPDKSFTEGGQISAESGLCPVELPTSPTSLRANWGFKDNNVLGYKVICKGTEQAYFGKRGIKSTSEISAVAVPVTVGASKYAAYCSTYALDFSATEVKAYKAKVDGNKVVLTQVDEVPANTGVILYCETPDDYIVPVIASASAITENELIGVTTRTLVEWTTGGDGKYNYILQGGQFKKAATGGYLKANRAYLHTSYDVTSATARDYLEFSFEGEEETTGVNKVTTTNRTNNTNEFFNLAGQRVANPTKGLYIVNGKKVIIK